MLTILIPLAGEGRRFREAGYNMPKPFIDVNGKPMIERVIDNIDPKCPARWIFAIRDSSFASYFWQKKPGCFVVECSGTDGACRDLRYRCSPPRTGFGRVLGDHRRGSTDGSRRSRRGATSELRPNEGSGPMQRPCRSCHLVGVDHVGAVLDPHRYALYKSVAL